jgi:Flp pilus assembly pilin Flp
VATVAVRSKGTKQMEKTHELLASMTVSALSLKARIDARNDSHNEAGFTAVEWAVVAAIILAGAILIATQVTNGGKTVSSSIVYKAP